ncbi:hypothetical protein IPZ58_12155 [Streptomyces roseoverticillatus]|uniref:RICIN domain-containing protein n=1 Tax=Streptomyces roseoverticillatus TaxID=66429 RepID=UPI001F233DD1|nr:RICIN domain-containing protein [Streptomyces roseoverticillatus]MCF3102334.1 hypothetical protein [Streptomyces roseoverticillatus]
MNRTIKRAAKLFTAPAAALTLLLPVLAVTATPAAAATDAYTFTNTDGTLNATGNNDGNQISVTPDGTNYPNWRLINLSAPGTFNIASTSSGKCIYASQPAVQLSCGKDGEQWHFRPVDGKPNAFGIVRRDDSSGTEYCMDNRGGLHLWGILAQPNACNGSASQEWTVPASKAAEARKLALDYYADLCSKKTSTCSWTQKSEGQPEVLPRQPASSVWYNDTSGTMKQVFTTIYHSGWAQSYSAGVSTSVGVSTPVQAMISSQLSATQTYQSDETTVNGIAIDVPSKNYGWVDFAAVGKKVTGTWTFNTDNQPWTADATVTVPVINSAAGSTMYVARTSTTPPGTGAGSTDVKPAALATTTTTTVDMPKGTHLTAYKGGVRALDDTDGSTIATILPGAVKATDGTTHKINVSVDGNKVTQTIDGATGSTIEGTVTPPVFSVGTADPAPVGTLSAKTALAKKTALAMRAASSDKDKDKDKEKLNCIRDKMVAGIIGGFAGTIEAGGAGAMPGALGGLAIGIVTCK